MTWQLWILFAFYLATLAALLHERRKLRRHHAEHIRKLRAVNDGTMDQLRLEISELEKNSKAAARDFESTKEDAVRAAQDIINLLE